MGNGPVWRRLGNRYSEIASRHAHGPPRYVDDSDTFVLSGMEDLFLFHCKPDSPKTYRPRTEGVFARIEHRRQQQITTGRSRQKKDWSAITEI